MSSMRNGLALLAVVGLVCACGGSGTNSSSARASPVRTAAAAEPQTVAAGHDAPRREVEGTNRVLDSAATEEQQKAAIAGAEPGAASLEGGIGETVGIDLAFPQGGPAESVTGLRTEIAMTELVPATTPNGAASVQCTVRLRRKDGSDAGPAWSGRERHPEGWTGRLVHGVKISLFFAGPLGTGWYVSLTPDLSDRAHVRWTATGEYVACTK
jgi:hypothetical protein